jgi:hypothetical protein
VQVIYRARLLSDVAAGPESQEVGLFRWDEIPWDDLAFPSVRWALHHYRGCATKPCSRPAPIRPASTETTESPLPGFLALAFFGWSNVPKGNS